MKVVIIVSQRFCLLYKQPPALYRNVLHRRSRKKHIFSLQRRSKDPWLRNSYFLNSWRLSVLAKEKVSTNLYPLPSPPFCCPYQTSTLGCNMKLGQNHLILSPLFLCKVSSSDHSPSAFTYSQVSYFCGHYSALIVTDWSNSKAHVAYLLMGLHQPGSEHALEMFVSS